MEVAFCVRQAAVEDTKEVSRILREAARWLEERGQPLWQDDELRPAGIAAEVAAGAYFLGGEEGGAVATVRFQLAAGRRRDDTVCVLTHLKRYMGRCRLRTR